MYQKWPDILQCHGHVRLVARCRAARGSLPPVVNDHDGGRYAGAVVAVAVASRQVVRMNIECNGTTCREKDEPARYGTAQVAVNAVAGRYDVRHGSRNA